MADTAEIVLVRRPVPLAARKPGEADAHLARELHDGVAGELSTMLLDLERFRVEQHGRQSVLLEISQLQEQLRFVLSNVRRLLYAQRELPGVEPDFIGALSRGLVRRFAERTGLRIHLSVARSWPQVLPSETALNLRRIVQEALNNIDRHSGARAVFIRFNVGPVEQWAEVTIADDGRGYGAESGGLEPGLGLVGIEERAVLMGARVSVSNRRRGGSVMSLLLPRRSLGL